MSESLGRTRTGVSSRGSVSALLALLIPRPTTGLPRAVDHSLVVGVSILIVSYVASPVAVAAVPRRRRRAQPVKPQS